jgi:hypothetical protein
MRSPPESISQTLHGRDRQTSFHEDNRISRVKRQAGQPPFLMTTFIDLSPNMTRRTPWS